MTPTRDPWGIQELHAKDAAALTLLGFTDRQARFLLTVLQHSGAFVERQYCRFAGIVHGQKTHDFIEKLVSQRFAREIRPGALHRGRMYHLHHKRLYAAIGQRDNRNRKRAPMGRLVERLMLLDAVQDEGELIWLATENDKIRYFSLRLYDSGLRHGELPHLTFGPGPRKTFRLFPDKLPIGINALGTNHVFLYLLRRPAPVDFRAFLVRHFELLVMLQRWTIRVVVPRRLAKAIRIYEHAFHEELTRPLHPSTVDELAWYFRERKALEDGAPEPKAPRFHTDEVRFCGPRFRVLYRLWTRNGDRVLSHIRSPLLADKFERGEANLEFTVLTRQYLHLSHMVGVA